jgi:hypothetical protein
MLPINSQPSIQFFFGGGFDPALLEPVLIFWLRLSANFENRKFVRGFPSESITCEKKPGFVVALPDEASSFVRNAELGSDNDVRVVVLFAGILGPELVVGGVCGPFEEDVVAAEYVDCDKAGVFA